MSDREVNKCPFFEQCPLPYKNSYYCYKDHLKCKIYNILKNTDEMLLKKLNPMIQNIYEAISEKINNLENKIKNLETLEERLTILQIKKDEFDKIKNQNKLLNSKVNYLEDKMKELDKTLTEKCKITDINYGVIANRIKSLEGYQTEVKCEFDKEMTTKMNNMDILKKCKYCGLPFIWQQDTDGKWIAHHTNTENGMCFSYFKNNEDNFEY